jgi:hypothetical protein
MRESIYPQELIFTIRITSGLANYKLIFEFFDNFMTTISKGSSKLVIEDLKGEEDENLINLSNTIFFNGL